MNTFKFLLFAVIALTVFATSPLVAQQKRTSPHETISTKIDGNRVIIVYGRPYSKDPKTGEVRKIWGSLVPWGQVWRLGSDEATLLITQRAISIGGTLVPAGAYTLFLLPTEAKTQLIVSKQIGQWGLEYDQSQDFARITVTQEPAPKPADQLTLSLTRNLSGGGALNIIWEETQFTVPIALAK